MKASSNNIKPVFVIEQDESVTMYEPNEELTSLVKAEPIGEQKIWKIKNKQKAHRMKERTRIQKDKSITDNDKETQIQALE